MNEEIALFVADSHVQLEALETELLILERTPQAADTLDAAFRSIHTIKGNAMVVQQGEVEWFAHVAESVLMRLREGELAADAQLISVLLACCDHLRFLIGLSSLESNESPAFAEEDRARLIGLLVPYMSSDSPAATAPPAPSISQAKSPEECWHLAIRFAPDVLRQGLDPSGFLQHLSSIGHIFDLRTGCEDLPGIDDYDPERCYLHFEVWLDTPADKQAIEDVFSFVREQSRVLITPPASHLQAFVDSIQALPDADLHAGEMLMRVGALTPAELDSSLRAQRSGAVDSKPLGSILVEEGYVAPELLSAVLQRQDEIKQDVLREPLHIRIPGEQLDALLARLDALHSSLSELCAQAGPLSADTLRPLLAELQLSREQAEHFRSVPFKTLFRRLHRVVRDSAHDLGKRAELQLHGGSLLLDRATADLLADALMHLLRNAIDHGLETPEQRLHAGKAAQGCLRVAAEADAQGLCIRVSDDGAGIDAERVRQAAIARGLLAPHVELDAETLHAMLFTPGFSTAETLSHYSGRGVGLDVVNETLAALHGSISLSSMPGLGCCFELRLPPGALRPLGQSAAPASLRSVA